MQEVDVVFLYEHAARELDVACAVVAGLRQAGLSVNIYHWPTGFPKAVLQVRPKIVILPFCYSERNYDALLAYWRNPIFFNMSWEQIFYVGNQKAKTPHGKFATRYVIHHAWSGSYTSFLQENGIPSENILINAQPAYKLYDQPYRNYYPTRQELAERHGLDKNLRWVFFPENYNWAFYSESTLEQFVQSGQSQDDVYAMKEFCDHSLKEVLGWCAEAAEGNIEIILRPRLSTVIQEFKAFVERVLPEIPRHMHIIQSGSVREWILVSNLVVSSYSTSLIEASVAGKPAYILEPFPIPTSLHVDWHDLLPHIKNIRAFLFACTNVENNMDERLSRWAQQTLMGQGDAIRKLTEFVISLARGEIEPPPKASREVAIPTLKFVPPAWMWSIYRSVKQWIRYPKSAGIESEFIKDFLPSAVIEDRIADWSVVLSRKKV